MTCDGVLHAYECCEYWHAYSYDAAARPCEPPYDVYAGSLVYRAMQLSPLRADEPNQNAISV